MTRPMRARAHSQNFGVSHARAWAHVARPAPTRRPALTPRVAHVRPLGAARLFIPPWRNSIPSLNGEEDTGSNSTRMPDDDLGSFLESLSSISSNVERDHMDIDVALEEILSGETGAKFAERLTVLDDCEDVRGEYIRLPRAFRGRPCYEKDDGTMFLFYSSWQQRWCFGPDLGYASDSIGDTCIPEGVELPAVEFAGCRIAATADGVHPDNAPGLPLLHDEDGGGERRADPSGFEAVSDHSQVYAVGAQYGSTTHGFTAPDNTTGQMGLGGPIFATQVTVVIDDDAKRGEYQLLPDVFNGRPLYRREDGAVLLFFDDRRSGWQFVEMSQEARAQPISTMLSQRPVGMFEGFDVSNEGLLLKMPPQSAGRGTPLVVNVHQQAPPYTDDLHGVSEPAVTLASARRRAQWLTVIDESAAINGEYCLVRAGAGGVSHYRKEDGSMFMFFDVARGFWRFCESLADVSSSRYVADAPDSAVTSSVFAGSEEMGHGAAPGMVVGTESIFAHTGASSPSTCRSGARVAAASKAKCAACTVS